VRRLIGVLVVVAIMVGGLALGDTVARHRVQTGAAKAIEATLPGSTATVSISSFPFLGRLAVAGTVPQLTADVDQVTAAGFTFDDVDLVVHDLKFDTSQLWRGRLKLDSISSGTVTAELPQSSIDHATGLPVTLGSGTVGVAGVQIPATVAVVDNKVTLTLPLIAPITFTVPQLSILPCVGSAVIHSGVIDLSCDFTQVPSALANLSVKL
jgi:hypothetical protein